ncbi:MAG: ATP-binding protein [Defluviitaleaceae bacterium]|nr:ATP-binding protein [Defluviitaleaceae bacterium]
MKKHLQLYEEVSNKLTSGEKVDYITPIALSQDEVLGAAYNALIKYVGDRAAEVRKSQQMIDSVTTVIEAPLIIIGANGRVDYANNSFLKLVKRDSLTNVSYEKIKNKALKALLQDVLIREVASKKEIDIKQQYYEAVSQPLYDDGQRFSGVVLLFHNVTELKTYQNLQREFFSNASHELKTPITAIKGCVDILISGSAPQDMEKEFLSIIAKENLRLENLVKDLFLVNRFDTNQIDLKKESIDLNDLIEDVIKQVETLVALKSQSISLICDEQIHVEGDPLRLTQCFLNLITNAIHYTPETTQIEMMMTQTGSQIEIKIKDYGTGIPKKDLPHIFERFYRVDRARSRHSGGTGLGLAIVKATIEAHQGKITVESEEEVGTTFTMTLPAKSSI